MTMRQFVKYIITVFITLFLFAMYAARTESQEACIDFSGDVVNGVTVPLPTTCVETGYAQINYLCDGIVQVTAKVEDYFYISGGTNVYVYMEENETQVFNLGVFEFAEVWTDYYGFAGLVDYVERECEETPISDGRTNVGWGDHQAVLYLVDNVINIYRVIDSGGMFDFSVSVDGVFPSCNVDNSVCVYHLETDEYQINITDETGKTFVIRSADWTWQDLELEVIE